MRSGMFAAVLVLATVSCFPLRAAAAGAVPPVADKAAKKAPAGKIVDAGSFSIFVAGRRVAVEKFEIEQIGDGNVTRSEVQVDDGATKAVQKSELQMDGAGQLRRYAWNEVSPGKAESTVVPQDQLLVQRLVPSPTEKVIEQPYILPVSTVILDDYFFSQRELLAWRYLASGCQTGASGQTECKLTRMRYGALIPRQRTSVLVNMEYVGKEKVKIRGREVELNRFTLSGEGIDWALWLDGSNKLVRIMVPADSTEVVRD